MKNAISEQPENPGTWYVFMPSFNPLTEVLWYIQVFDDAGLNSTRRNPLGEPYRYTVLNRIPTIEMLTPSGNESYLEEVVITWTATDLDEDILTYSLSYNLEGTGWRLLAEGLIETSYSWNISELGYCETVSLRVEVDDGYGGLSSDECDYVFAVGEYLSDENNSTDTTDTTTTDSTSVISLIRLSS